MKSLTKSIQESIIKEAKTTMYVFFDHYSPESTYIYSGNNPTNIKRIEHNYDYEIVSGTGDLLIIQHSDEWGWCSRCSNMNVFKKDILNSIKESLSQYEKADGYLELEVGELYDTEIDEEDEIEEILKMNDAQLYKKFVEDFIKHSYIDGDSSSAVAIVDLKKQEEILAGDINIVFIDDEEIDEWFEE